MREFQLGWDLKRWGLDSKSMEGVSGSDATSSLREGWDRSEE